MNIQHHNNYMQIDRKWFGLNIAFMSVFAIIWNGFIFNIYSGMEPDAELSQKLLPLPFVAIGIGITYYAIAGWFNKTSIFVSRDAVEIQHKPIPWIGNKRLLVNNIKQLYTKEKISQNQNGTSVTYEVHVIVFNGKIIKLVSGLESSEQALFIEQEIEKYLKIENQPVRGEVG